MKPENTPNIVIIGAGLTGLTTAYYLKRQGFKVTVLEKSNRCGGVINTHNEKGFIYESGPNTGVLGNPEVIELFEDLGKTDIIERADKKAEKRLIWKKNKWHALPSGPFSGLTTPLFKMYDKFRLLSEPLRKKGNNPYESVAELVKRRMGKSFLNYAVDPFIGGVYAGDPSKLITKFALPKLYNLEQNYGSFIKGAIAKKKEPKEEREKKATKEVFSVKNGLSELINELKNQIGTDNIILNVSQTVINQTDNGFKVKYSTHTCSEEINCNKLITTCPAHSIKDILTFAEKDEIEAITNVEYAPVSQLILGYKNWDGLSVNAFGGLVPSIEKRNILGVLFTSSFFKNRAPENSVLLSVFIGGKRRPELDKLSDEEIINIGLNEIKNMLKPKDAILELTKIYKHKYAIPQYEISSEIRFKMANELERKYNGLIIGGNLKDGIGMADRIKQARNIAERIFSQTKNN
jgi:oxygen-dependent protoporphyrinogen oxidase